MFLSKRYSKISVSIIELVKVFVANLFLNFYLDIEQLEISNQSHDSDLVKMPACQVSLPDGGYSGHGVVCP